jgi:pilus assembly protein CpaB
MAITAGKRRLVLFMMAVGMAGLAAFMVKTYLDRKTEEIKAAYADKTEKVGIVVPKANIPSGTRVAINNFAIRKMPADMIPPDAVAPKDIERAVGQTMKVDLPIGRPLLWGYLSSGSTQSFSEMLEEDKRALTIAVDELNSISGMIRPHDRIDLFVIRTEKNNNPLDKKTKDTKVVMPLMQDVLVKATGNIVRRETAADGKTYDRRYSTLTLDLLPEEIGKVLIAQENGELKAALKRPEQGAIDYHATRETDLWPREEIKLEENANAKAIALYVGGQGGGMVMPQLLPYIEDAEQTAAPEAMLQNLYKEEIIARSGTGLTPEQIEQIERYQHRSSQAQIQTATTALQGTPMRPNPVANRQR